MKGKQLTLEEVLRLENGTRVWAEELNQIQKDWSGIHKKVLDKLIAEKDGMIYEIRHLDGRREDYGIEIFEWIDVYENPMMLFEEDDDSYDVVLNMATEIYNLRGLDLTEDNIDKIMKEFVEEK